MFWRRRARIRRFPGLSCRNKPREIKACMVWWTLRELRCAQHSLRQFRAMASKETPRTNDVIEAQLLARLHALRNLSITLRNLYYIGQEEVPK